MGPKHNISSYIWMKTLMKYHAIYFKKLFLQILNLHIIWGYFKLLDNIIEGKSLKLDF